jgi:predicted RNase H-like HicB family nuclease
MALSRDFPETCGVGDSPKEALREMRINSESVLDGAMREAGVYRMPLLPQPISKADIAIMLDKECADYVVSIVMATYVVFP